MFTSKPPIMTDGAQEEETWVDTPGVQYLIENLIPEAVKVVQGQPRYQPVLIVGPTGAGKTYVKNMIMEQAGFSNDLQLHVNCAAFTPELMESELFGHVKGAFTGAIKDRIGLVAEPAYMILVLDEIGTLPHYLQAKLLTFLDRGEFRKVGSNCVQTSHKKILAISNSRDFPDSLRADFRFRFFVIHVPGLCQRRADIPFLLHQLAPKVKWTHFDMLRLVAYNWPGNLRELRRFAELSESYHTEINEGPTGVLDWFDTRADRNFTGYRAPYANVPQPGDWDRFFELLWYYQDLAKDIDKQVQLFPMSKEQIDKRIPGKALTWKSVHAWSDCWQRWCRLFGRDPFSPEDLWELFLSGKRLPRPPDDVEGDAAGKDAERFNALEAELYKLMPWIYEKLPSRDEEIPPVPDSVLETLGKLSPRDYEQEWVKHNLRLGPAKTAKRYKMNQNTVKSMFRRHKEREKASNNKAK